MLLVYHDHDPSLLGEYTDAERPHRGDHLTRVRGHKLLYVALAARSLAPSYNDNIKQAR